MYVEHARRAITDTYTTAAATVLYRLSVGALSNITNNTFPTAIPALNTFDHRVYSTYYYERINQR